MTPTDYQNWLIAHGADIIADGAIGSATQSATLDVFVNLDARGVSDRQISRLATYVGCSYEQIMAVATVESGGSAYDSNGRPKILYERHKFHGFTDGQWSVTDYSNPQAGGYSVSSWDKLNAGLAKDVDAAFKSVSWGKFQVMGYWFPNIGFASALEMAYRTVRSEFWHYVLFAGYIKRIGKLEDELRRVSTNPEDCRPFALGYNGPAYAEGNYHVKIADEYARQMEGAIDL